MKPLLSIILICSILTSCNRKKSDKTQSESKSKIELNVGTEPEPKTELEVIRSKKKKDKINNYWALILDTISSKKEFKISDFKYTLELYTYSLNDSSIVRNLSDYKGQQYLDYSHTMVTDFILTSDSIRDYIQINRTNFESVLFSEFYSECNLFSTEVDSIIENNIYMTSDLAVPDSDNQWRVWYSIKINNHRLGKLEIKETDYVGL